MPFVRAGLSSLVFLLTADLSVWLALNALLTSPALIKGAKILALALAELTLSVGSSTITLFAHAMLDILETHSAGVTGLKVSSRSLHT